MASASMGSHHFDNLLNFRDVGKSINTFLGRRYVKEGLVYRSARPDDATLADRKLLADHFGIRTIIDLRTQTEHINVAKKRQADLQKPARLSPCDALAEPIHIPGIKYLEIKITGRRFERFMLSQLSWSSFFKFLLLFILGYRMPAIGIIGREVMLPRGLVGLGLDTIDQSQEETHEALSAYLEPLGLPNMVHCTQGKDRTGMVIALVLMILGVPLEAIQHDYALSDPGLISEKESRIAEIREIGLTEEFGVTAEDFVSKVAKHLETKYGSLDDYLDSIGFNASCRGKLRSLLLY